MVSGQASANSKHTGDSESCSPGFEVPRLQPQRASLQAFQVHTHQDRRHGFNDGDWVVFREASPAWDKLMFPEVRLTLFVGACRH